MNSRLLKRITDAIIYKDDAVLALNKPSGISVQGFDGCYPAHFVSWFHCMFILRFDRIVIFIVVAAVFA